MIDVSYLIANLDEVLGDNMFLKDAQKAENLKGSIHATFNQIETQIDQLECQLTATTNQTFSDMEELMSCSATLNPINASAESGIAISPTATTFHSPLSASKLFFSLQLVITNTAITASKRFVTFFIVLLFYYFNLRSQQLFRRLERKTASN